VDSNISQMVGKAKKGDKEALIQLVMARKDEYYRLAYSYTCSKEDSLDAMQDMIVILFNNINKLRDADAFYSWSRTILVNCCRRIVKKQSRIIPIDDSQEGEYHEDYQGREFKQDIMDSLKKLSLKQREAIILKYFFDMDYETISRITRVPVGTVKSRVFNGLSKLRQLFGGEY